MFMPVASWLKFELVGLLCNCVCRKCMLCLLTLCSRTDVRNCCAAIAYTPRGHTICEPCTASGWLTGAEPTAAAARLKRQLSVRVAVCLAAKRPLCSAIKLTARLYHHTTVTQTYSCIRLLHFLVSTLHLLHYYTIAITVTRAQQRHDSISKLRCTVGDKSHRLPRMHCTDAYK